MQGLDDLPVGGGGEKLQLDEFAQTSTNAQVDISGPIEERIVSKNWQIRAAAFEEIANQFKLADNQQSQEFRDHAGSWKKYLLDANPASLEKCLDALIIVKKIKIKQFLPHIEALASQSNPGQRQEAMNFYKESYRHLGEGLKALISGLKKQQLVSAY